MSQTEVDGYWGPITANYDWCERNYQYTFYIAEFFNAISSVPIALGGAYGMFNSVRYGYAHKLLFSYFIMMVVGVGSAAFHGTLLREGQVLDEVPMLWASVSLVYLAITFRSTSIVPLIVCVVYGIISTLVYFYVSFEGFILAYALTVFTLVVLSAMELRRLAENKSIVKYLILSAGSYIGGLFVFWIPEQILCGNRLEVHHQSILMRLQFHAIFHITSCLGTYYFMIYAVMAQYYTWKRNPYIVMHTFLEIPVVHIDMNSKQC